MRRLADEAIDDEFQRLKAKREQLRVLAARLDSWRNATEELNTLANRFGEDHHAGRQWLVRTLGILPREATVIWPAKNRRRQPDAKRDIGTDTKPAGTVVAPDVPGGDDSVPSVPYPMPMPAR